MAMITNDWLPAVREEFAKPYYRQLYQFVKEEYSRTVVYPPAEDIFNALHFTPLSEVKVLILGQDPYHNEHQAHGLSFSVLPDQKEIPPSLQNIYKELQDDLGAEEQEYLGRVLSEYEEAVSQDIQELARSCGLDLSECSVHIENNENSPQFGTVQSIFVVLPQQSGETEKEKLSNKIQEYYGLEERYVEIEIAGGEGPVDFSSDGGGDPVYSGIPGGK